MRIQTPQPSPLRQQSYGGDCSLGGRERHIGTDLNQSCNSHRNVDCGTAQGPPDSVLEMRTLANVSKERPMIVGKPVVLVIDIQKGSFMPTPPNSHLPLMPDYTERLARGRTVIDAARAANVPIIFFQEVHRASLIDFGRELDGSESVHCVEGQPGTPIAADVVGLRPDDYVISKRRYSCFYGTELEILLRALKAETLIMVGGFTDVCVHYTFVDGHQRDYYCRVAEDCVAGSSPAAHDAALNAMEYLQAGSRRSSAALVAELRHVSL